MMIKKNCVSAVCLWLDLRGIEIGIFLSFFRFILFVEREKNNRRVRTSLVISQHF
jgi:hypothetical protein